MELLPSPETRKTGVAPSWTEANPFARCNMRSKLVFEVSQRFSNRYQLCSMLAASARKMHRDGASTAQSINRSLSALHDMAQKPEGAKIAEPFTPVSVTVKVVDETGE